MISDAAYAQACNDLADRIRRWKGENPDAAPVLGFRYPKDVFVIGALSDLLPNDVAEANADGRDLIAACINGYTPQQMPTIAMFRAAWEYVEEEA